MESVQIAINKFISNFLAPPLALSKGAFFYPFYTLTIEAPPLDIGHIILMGQ